MKLRDVLPKFFFWGEYNDTRAYKFLDVEVVEKYKGYKDGQGWIGTHKNIYVWWELANGYAVGMNENPSCGLSFPVAKAKWSKVWVKQIICPYMNICDRMVDKHQLETFCAGKIEGYNQEVCHILHVSDTLHTQHKEETTHIEGLSKPREWSKISEAL